MFMYNRKAFKRQAKAAMRATKPHFMVVALVYWLLTVCLSLVVSVLSREGGDLIAIVAGFLQMVLMLFTMVMTVGLANYALRLSRGQGGDVRSLFCGFSFAGRAIGANLLVMIYTFLWCLLIMFIACVLVVPVAVLLMNTMMADWILYVAGGAVYAIAFALTYVISLRYSMVTFALADDPESGSGEAVRRSVRIMRRNKGKLFVLLLSFVGWYLLIGLVGAAIYSVGFLVSDTAWVYEAFAAMGDDLSEISTVATALSNQLWPWSLLVELVTLPLTLWLTVYMQTSYARFYNYVSGYDYFVRTQAEVAGKQGAPSAAPPVSGEESKPFEYTPPQPPAGGFYNRVPDLTAPAEEPSLEESTVEENPSDDTGEI